MAVVIASDSSGAAETALYDEACLCADLHQSSEIAVPPFRPLVAAGAPALIRFHSAGSAL